VSACPLLGPPSLRGRAAQHAHALIARLICQRQIITVLACWALRPGRESPTGQLCITGLRWLIQQSAAGPSAACYTHTSVLRVLTTRVRLNFDCAREA